MALRSARVVVLVVCFVPSCGSIRMASQTLAAQTAPAPSDALASPQTTSPPTTAPQNSTSRARDFWNKEFAEGKALLDKQPSPLLIGAIEGRKRGTALDLGMGQGRNAVYLAEKGWQVTGVDVSDVAVNEAGKTATARGAKLQGIVSDLDAFDFGEEQFDLIASFYMHSWHRRSKTDVPTRIYDALKPGGLLVIEGFAEPPNRAGFKTDELARVFGRMNILRNEAVEDYPAWYSPEKTPLVRFVAQK